MSNWLRPDAETGPERMFLLSHCSELIGLVDRVETLGGRFALESPVLRGTMISIELPFVLPATDERL